MQLLEAQSHHSNKCIIVGWILLGKELQTGFLEGVNGEQEGAEGARVVGEVG